MDLGSNVSVGIDTWIGLEWRIMMHEKAMTEEWIDTRFLYILQHQFEWKILYDSHGPRNFNLQCYGIKGARSRHRKFIQVSTIYPAPRKCTKTPSNHRVFGLPATVSTFR